MAPRPVFRRKIFLRKIQASELTSYPSFSVATIQIEGTRRLLDEFSSPETLIELLALDAFETFRQESTLHVRYPPGAITAPMPAKTAVATCMPMPPFESHTLVAPVQHSRWFIEAF